MNTPQEMLESGHALKPIPRGLKGPRTPGWNERGHAITNPLDAHKLEGCNIGLLHAYCLPVPTCALDIDNFELACKWLSEKGLDITTFYSEEESVGSYSGQPGRFKLFFRLPRGEQALLTRQVIVDGKVALEFRCASAGGKTVQDVLPPSIHPSGTQYQWMTSVSVSNMPTLPDKLLQLWKGLVTQPECDAASQRLFWDVPDYITSLGRSQLMRELTAYGSSDKPSLELIRMQCPQVREAIETGGRDRSEPLWRADIGLIKHTDGGDFACHQSSVNHPTYSREETERKIAAYTAGPTTCEHYRQLNPTVCTACKHYGQIKSPIILGRISAEAESQDLFSNEPLSAGRRPFKLLSAGQVLEKPVTPRAFLISELLPQRVIAGLIAPGGSGKSMLAMHIGVALAGGSSLFGQFYAPRPGTVVFLSGEDDIDEMHRRLSAILATEAKGTRQSVNNNLHLVDRSEDFDLFTRRLTHGDAEITPVLDELVSAILAQAANPIDLLIVDPAARFRGGEENSASDVNRFIQALYTLKDRLACTVLVLHHVNKSAKTNGASQNNARGSSAFSDGVRMMLELSLLDASDTLVLSCVKSNYGRRPEPISLLRQADGTFRASNLTSKDMRTLSVMREIAHADMTKEQFKKQFGGKNRKLGISDRELRDVFTDLEAKGWLLADQRKPMKLTSTGQKQLEGP